MADSNSGGSGGVAAVAIVVVVVLAILAGGYLLLGRGGLGTGHSMTANISTPAGPISGTATSK
ncbi:MAG: hypothetical protein JO303_18755 [Caulobacteraceae bacterium]|nr:hypothetical protein [Caulobacteraceae bacterium]